MQILWRGLRGAVVGASITAAVAVTATALLFGFQIMAFDRYDAVDRERDLKHMMEVLPLVALAGVLVGGVGGLVAKLPARGIGMLTSISVVGGCAVLARLPTIAQPRYTGTSEPSYIPVVIAALVGASLVLVYEIVVTKRTDRSCSRAQDIPSHTRK
jgi:hypothetical protein